MLFVPGHDRLVCEINGLGTNTAAETIADVAVGLKGLNEEYKLVELTNELEGGNGNIIGVELGDATFPLAQATFLIPYQSEALLLAQYLVPGVPVKLEVKHIGYQDPYCGH